MPSHFSDKTLEPVIKEPIQLIKRSIIVEITDYLDEVLNQIEALDYEVEYSFDSQALFDVLNYDLPDGVNKSQKITFINDVVKQCQFFYDLCGSSSIRVQIKIITSNMCKLFHVDNIKQRLLCTYRGAGTEWLDNSNVNREGLGHGDNLNIVKDFSKINTANCFDVLILKGEKYSKLVNGGVHRSPSFESDSKTRVLLKIDEI